MVGFNPIGASPVGAIDNAAAPPGYYYPSSGILTFGGYRPITTGITPTYCSVIFREALYSGNSNTRISILSRESFYAAIAGVREAKIVRELMISTVSPLPRIVSVHSVSREVMKSFHSTFMSSISREIMRDTTAVTRIADLSREVLFAISAAVKESQLVREALYATNPAALVSAVVREVMRSGGVMAIADDGFVSIIW